jgi:hypothetical protein
MMTRRQANIGLLSASAIVTSGLSELIKLIALAAVVIPANSLIGNLIGTFIRRTMYRTRGAQLLTYAGTCPLSIDTADDLGQDARKGLAPYQYSKMLQTNTRFTGKFNDMQSARAQNIFYRAERSQRR